MSARAQSPPLIKNTPTVFRSNAGRSGRMNNARYFMLTGRGAAETVRHGLPSAAEDVGGLRP